MEQLLHDIGHVYDEGIVDAGRQAELFLLIAFLLSFGFIRTSAHMIRSERFQWWPGNVDVGGTHVHHLVWGILLMLVAGYVVIAFEPGSPEREIIAVLFGIGMGLTLDEFALWLNLKDVYWTQKGRQSIDAVVIAATIGWLVLLGVRVWVDLADEVESAVRVGVAWAGVAGVVLCIVNALKGKLGMAVASLVAPVIGLVGAVRLARPGSLWARLYGEERAMRARARFAA